MPAMFELEKNMHVRPREVASCAVEEFPSLNGWAVQLSLKNGSQPYTMLNTYDEASELADRLVYACNKEADNASR